MQAWLASDLDKPVGSPGVRASKVPLVKDELAAEIDGMIKGVGPVEKK